MGAPSPPIHHSSVKCAILTQAHSENSVGVSKKKLTRMMTKSQPVIKTGSKREELSGMGRVCAWVWTG